MDDNYLDRCVICRDWDLTVPEAEAYKTLKNALYNTVAGTSLALFFQMFFSSAGKIQLGSDICPVVAMLSWIFSKGAEEVEYHAVLLSVRV